VEKKRGLGTGVGDNGKGNKGTPLVLVGGTSTWYFSKGGISRKGSVTAHNLALMGGENNLGQEKNCAQMGKRGPGIQTNVGTRGKGKKKNKTKGKKRGVGEVSRKDPKEQMEKGTSITDEQSQEGKQRGKKT